MPIALRCCSSWHVPRLDFPLTIIAPAPKFSKDATPQGAISPFLPLLVRCADGISNREADWDGVEYHYVSGSRLHIDVEAESSLIATLNAYIESPATAYAPSTLDHVLPKTRHRAGTSASSLMEKTS